MGLNPFNFDAPFVATDGLLYAGKRYRGDEEFPWRTLGISEAELWDLWVLGCVNSREPAASVVPSKAPSPEELSEAELERLTAPRTAPTQPAQPAVKPPDRPRQSARR